MMSAKTLLVIVAFATTSSGYGLAESRSERAEATSSNRAQTKIATLNLQRISIEPQQLRSDHSSSGVQAFRGPNGRVLARDGGVVLRGTQERPIVTVQPAPGGGDLLVYFGSGNYGIYDLKGTLIADLPKLHPLFEDASIASWRWKDSRSLIGGTEVSPPIRRPLYPDRDILPTSTLFFLYEPYDDPSTVHMLQAPEPPVGTVIRLEGVTVDGALLLGIVEPEQYFGGPARQIIGTFEVDW